MQAIDGIDLTKEVKFAEAEILDDNRRKVRAMIGGIIGDLRRFREEKVQAEQTLAKLTQKIDSAESKYKKLIEGDWSVLNENMTKNQPSSEK